MRLPILGLFSLVGLPVVFTLQQPQPAPAPNSPRLEALTWQEAERVLTPDTVVLLPLGAASKEHGPHLKLRNDLTLAEYFTERVATSTSVVVAPTLTYHFYPAFLEYPGSTSLLMPTARDMTADVVRSLAAYGPKRFYVLNTGVSTVRALEPAAKLLAADGVLVQYTNLSRIEATIKGFIEQEGGTHADEVETSMMLYINPSTVDMSKAVKDYTPSRGGGALTRLRGGKGTYSPTGTWGDPTRATRDKGRVFVDAWLTGMLDDIAKLRTAPLPERTAAAAPVEPAPPPARAAVADKLPPPLAGERCSPGDERSIVGLGSAFATLWRQQDAEKLGGLWSLNGDIIHPDGTIERGSVAITQNRAQLFARREYRGSRHPLTLAMIRCLTSDLAVADGKWELSGVVDSAGKPVPLMEGQVTLVLKRDGRWAIEAYRYTIKPTSGSSSQAPQKRPGPPGGPGL